MAKHTKELLGSDFIRVIVSDDFILERGLQNRIAFDSVHQYLDWEESQTDHVMILDNKGCSTEIPIGWVVAESDPSVLGS